MWTRAELKRNARRVLKRYYVQAFLVSLIIQLPGIWSSIADVWSDKMSGILEGFWEAGWVLSSGLLIETVIWSVFLFLVTFFLRSVLEVSACRFYVQSRNRGESAGIMTLFEGFRDGRYKNIVLAMLLRGIRVFLWGLLFILPGIVKTYEYAMVPYILSDDPYLSAQDALARSRYLMYGHKWGFFVLQLSFLGWNILGLLLFNIGGYFFRPYYEATYAEFYTALKETTPDYGVYGG